VTGVGERAELTATGKPERAGCQAAERSSADGRGLERNDIEKRSALPAKAANYLLSIYLLNWACCLAPGAFFSLPAANGKFLGLLYACWGRGQACP